MERSRPDLCARSLAAAGLILAFGFTACNESTGNQKPAPVTVTEVLSDVSSKVIYGTYTDFALEADSLQQAIDRLAQIPDEANLAAARQAWRDARVPWESNEGFLFGPVETIPVDPRIDSWPLNKVDFDTMLKSGVPLTKEYIDGLDGNLKGFHAIEYLLFGDGAGVRHAANVTARELEYLRAATASLKGKVDTLLWAWNPAGGDFLGAFQSAGRGSTVYASQEQALKELLTGVVNICDEVANEKMYKVYHFDPPDLTQEESRFSNNSTADFANNLRSARNVYLGVYGGQSGKGLKALVEKQDAALAALVEAQMDSAIAATEAMGVFGDAVFNARDKVDAASTAIRTLRATLVLRVDSVLGLQ